MASFGDDIDRMLESQAGSYFEKGPRGRGRGGDERRRRSRSRDRGDRDRGRRRERDRRSRKTPEEIQAMRNDRLEKERERDQRTVFAAQIHPKNEEREIFDFFSDVGKVIDIQLIRDTRTLKSKGLAYIEFEDRRSVPHALALSGRNLNGYPVLVHLTQTDRDYAPKTQSAVNMSSEKPKTLHVRNLHKQLSEDDILPIFNAFGEVSNVNLIKGSDTNQAFIQFRRGTEGTTAMVQLNGLEVVGLQISVTEATDDAKMRADQMRNGEVRTARFEDESGNGGVVMSLQDKQRLMNNLAERAGLSVPEQNTFAQYPGGATKQEQTSATNCVLLTNMFDPAQETDPDFDLEIREDVREEVSTHGRLLHIYVDKSSKDGRIFLKFENSAVAASAFKALDGRWFAQNRIVASYMNPREYEIQFPGV